MHDMCGRVIQASPPDQLGLKIIDALDPRDNRVTGGPFGNVPPRYNGAPSQQLWVIRQNPQTSERSIDLLQWGLIPYWCEDKPKPPPINAKAETVDRLPMFREAYRKRRCIVPIDGFFEWMAVKGSKVKQPYAIAMQDRSPFGLAGLWENWKNPATGVLRRVHARRMPPQQGTIRPLTGNLFDEARSGGVDLPQRSFSEALFVPRDHGHMIIGSEGKGCRRFGPSGSRASHRL